MLDKNVGIDKKGGTLTAHKVGAAVKIFRGALVMLNAAGFLVPAAATAGAKFAGIAYQEVDNTGGANGDKIVQVEKVGSHHLTGAMVQADVGKNAYAVDDETITVIYAPNLVLVGVVDEIEDAKGWVRIDVDSSRGETAIADLGAFTDPPSAGEMATLVTTVNSMLAAMRKSEVIQG